ncbi:ribonuclease H-like domain-containing protein [Tanacetum coccineum]
MKIHSRMQVDPNRVVKWVPSHKVITAAIFASENTENAPFGQLTYLRIYEGVLKKGEFITNSNTRMEIKARLKRISSLHVKGKYDKPFALALIDVNSEATVSTGIRASIKWNGRKLLQGNTTRTIKGALIKRNKDGIDDLDIDDLYNNLKVFEADIKEDTSSSNEVNIANGVSTASGHNSQGQASSSSYTDDLMFSLFVNQSNSPQL